MYDRSVALELPRNVSSTRGNKYKLQNHSFHYNFRKFSFAARVVNAWNSLPDHVPSKHSDVAPRSSGRHVHRQRVVIQFLTSGRRPADVSD